MPWLRLPSNGTSSSGLHGQQMLRWGFTFFCKHNKSTTANSSSPLFTFYSHAFTFDLSLSTREDFNTCYFLFRTPISTTSTSTSMSSCWKRQRSWSWTLRLAVSSKVFRVFTSYFLLDVSSWRLLKVVALFASDGSNLIGKAQVERIQGEFCLLLYRCFFFTSFTYPVFFHKNPEKFANLFQILRFLVDRDGQVKAARR